MKKLITVSSILFLTLIASFTPLRAAAHSTAAAANFSVTKTADTNDGSCDAADCSLREALVAANANPGEDIILLPAGVYTLTLPGADEDQAATGDLDINDSVTIQGDSASTTIIDGGGLDRVFHIPQSSSVHMTDLTIRNGKVDGAGGGIWINGGQTTLERVVVTANSSSNGGGIAQPNGGTMLVYSSTISNNTTTGVGGGIQNYDGTVTLTNVTISSNTASSSGGGGGIYTFRGPNGGVVNLVNCTVTANKSGISPASGIVNYGGTVNLRNTIVAGNENVDTAGALTSQGYNLLQYLNSSVSGNTTGNLLGVDARLGPLQNNGGPTPTHVLYKDSPAVDRGSPSTPGSGGSSCESKDQRGLTRPQGTRCDIGAYELSPLGTISGVVYDPIAQKGMPGVTVRLDFDHFGGSPSRTLVSDAYGWVSFMNVPTGSYSLAALPPSGWIGAGKQITVMVSDQSTYLLSLKKEIALLSPANGAAVETASPRLCWEPLPQAVSYTLQINGPGGTLLENPTVFGTCYDIALPLQDSATYSWSLANASDSRGWSIGGSQTFQFTYHSAPITQVIDPSTDTTLTSWDQGTVLDFPSNTFADPGTVTYQPAPQSPDPYPLAAAQKTYEVNSTVPLVEGEAYQVTITYTDLDLQTIDPSTLALYYWDPDTSQWVKESTSQLDPVTHTLTASPTHFSTWAVLGEPHRIFFPLVRR